MFWFFVTSRSRDSVRGKRETSRSANTRREPRTRNVLVNGRLPPSAAESVLRVQSTLATNGVSTRVRRTLRRASRTTLHSGARTAREICQDHSRDYSGPHAGVRRNGTATAAHPTFRGRKDLSFNGLRDFRRRFRPARARASGDERARHPPGARFARIAYSPVRRSRVQRGPGRLAPRARRATPDRRSHMPRAVNHLERVQRASRSPRV